MPDVDLTAVGTFALALATVYLGWQAHAQVVLSGKTEDQRRGETQILEADPLTVELFDTNTRDAEEKPQLRIKATSTGDKPVTAITATIRSDDRAESTSRGQDSLAPGAVAVLTLPFAPFDLLDHCQVVVESHGLLGQRIIQTYRVRTDRIRGDQAGVPWYLERQEIVPSVTGAWSSVVTFTN